MSPPPSSIGAVSAGIRYQVRHFWWLALPMLYESHIAKVVVEHREVDAVDDVVVYYTAPGVNDAGSLVDVDFTQVKFHVAESGLVDHEAIIDPGWTSTKLPLLKRFCDAWLVIRRTHSNPRLSLVTNWPWDTASPIREYMRDGGRIADAFFTKGTATDIGKIRASWQSACGISDDDFRAFISSVRFKTSAFSQGEVGECVRDRCQLAGLVPIDPSVDWSPYDDLGFRLIESGRTEHTPESLRKLVTEQRLFQTPTPPFQSTLAVRSFRRFADVPSTSGVCVIDLTDLFCERRAINDKVWDTEVKLRVETAMQTISSLEQPVHVALDAHLSIAWYIGTKLGPKSGIPVLLRQRIKAMPVQLWDVSAPRRPGDAGDWILAVEKLCDASDLAVVVSVSHDALEDSKRFIAGMLPTVGTLLHFRLPEVGPSIIVDGGHARWLADALTRGIHDEVAKLLPGRTHIFPATPSSLMFLLGQEAPAIGPTTVYEFDFGNPGRTYQAGIAY